MSWHRASGKWNFCDGYAAAWQKEIQQFCGDAWQPGNPANTFLEVELRGRRYYMEIIVERHLADGGKAILGVDTLEPSRFHQALAGVDLPVHYEWARFSVEPLAEKLTSLNDLRRVAAGLAERIQIASCRGFTCSICKTAGGVEREQVMLFEFSRGDTLLEKSTLHRPIELPVCSLCQTRHCRACANACAARKAAADAADARARETQQLNEEARDKKQQRKGGALQPMCAHPGPRVPEAANEVP